MRLSRRSPVTSALFALVSLTLASLASPASAQTTTCVTVPSNSTWDAKIAVAANFYGPAQDLITSFTSSGQPGAGKHIRICENATAVLNAEIRTGTSGYSLFLAANTATPVGLQGTIYVQSGATAQLYAKGIPVLFARRVTVGDVATLMPGLASGVWANVPDSDLSGNPMDTDASQTVAVADPSAAPYGDAGFKIMNSMQVLSYPPVPSPYPTFLSSLYGNIDLTFNSVAASPYPNKSGFVSKAQICSGIGGTMPTYIYVQFTNTAFVLPQSGILISSGDATQDGIGNDILNYMLHNTDTSYWPTFLTNHCYGQISGPIFLTSGPHPKGQTFMKTALRKKKKPSKKH